MLNVVNSLEKTSTPYLNGGEDCMDKFVETLSQIKHEIYEKMKEVKPMEISPEQEQEFQSSTRCSICNIVFLRR